MSVVNVGGGGSGGNFYTQGNNTPAFMPAGSNTNFSGGMWTDPNALINAIEGQPKTQSTSTSNSGTSGAGGGGGGGGGGWASPSIQGGSSNNTFNNDATISALGGAIPQAYKQQRFNTLLNTLNPYLSKFSSTAPQYNVQPQNTNWPTIGGQQPWSDQRLNETINADRARNTQQAQGDAARSAASFGGSGMGTNSPLYAALQAQGAAAANATSSANEQQYRGTAADANAKFLEQMQGLQSQQAANQANVGLGYQQLGEKSYADARQIQANQFNALLQALGSLGG